MFNFPTSFIFFEKFHRYTINRFLLKSYVKQMYFGNDIPHLKQLPHQRNILTFPFQKHHISLFSYEPDIKINAPLTNTHGPSDRTSLSIRSSRLLQITVDGVLTSDSMDTWIQILLWAQWRVRIFGFKATTLMYLVLCWLRNL